MMDATRFLQNLKAAVSAGVNTWLLNGGLTASAGLKSTSATDGVGYATGAGGAVTQLTSRTTAVTINKPCGAITLFSAAASVPWVKFTVINSTVAATDVPHVVHKSGTSDFLVLINRVAAGAFDVSISSTGGVAVDSPVFAFVILKGVVA